MSVSPISSLAKTYQQKTDKQHVLDNPDTYTGPMEMTEYQTYIYNSTDNRIVPKNLVIIPGLYKLFDEGIVNCRDHVQRMQTAIQSKKENIIPVSKISVNIEADGTIIMRNDGNGIDVVKHPENNMWIPEMIFGHLRTSTNYNKDEENCIGGKNGFGFKLVLLWSTWGKIETVDHTRKLKYSQEFTDNLNTIKPPIITKYTKKPYTEVSFRPDYARLGMKNLTSDIISLFKRRVYDIAAVTDKKVKVYFNDEQIPVQTYQNYIDKFIGNTSETKRVYESANERWEYAVCLAKTEEFTHVSTVNGIFTSKGGKHIDYILGQIVRKLTAYIKKKKKVDVKSSTIKEQLMLFVRCDIVKPTFDSQTKDYMTTPISKFGSTCDISDKFIENIAKIGVMDTACALTEVKTCKDIKKTDGAKTKSVRGIPKLIDANFAGTSSSTKCSLILCEGDSAKAGIVSGLSKEDRDYIGVYPMRGKLLNVRDEAQLRVMENKEINEIKRILGLESNFNYTVDTANKKLRYSKIIFMTDQDLDGSHIKGLGLNLFDVQWHSLLEIPNFVGFMNTPILKARKGKSEKLFYNDGEYNEWKENENTAGWKIKYYKGLGTSTGKEFKEYMLHKKIVYFKSESDNYDAIDMVFNKKRASDRKDWLATYDRDRYLDTKETEITYEQFIHNEMIHFSKYDCDRSIPNLMDGLKTSQRKVAYTGFKRKLTNEIKVAQYSGSVSEISCYHHGEQSLNGAIVGMAQEYVGSNNIPILEPKGQFGTRLQGGHDSASVRYIFTNLNPLTRSIFIESDDLVLDYLQDDGTPVEPIYYAPIIPMIVVNGGSGIGTGFSSSVMAHNALHIIDYITGVLQGTSPENLPVIEPYYEGFRGSITKIADSKYLIKGCYDIISEKQVRITELPVGTWTDNYKQDLESIIDKANKVPGSSSKSENKISVAKAKSKNPIVDYTDMSTDIKVDITITFANGVINQLIAKETDYGCNALEKLLKLYTTKTTTNMHMFDEKEKLKKFDNILDIISHYMKVRQDVYVKRKAAQLEILKRDVMLLENKAKFITEILEETIDLRRKKSSQIVELLTVKKYAIIDKDDSFKYLVKLPMDSVSEENAGRLLVDCKNKTGELEKLSNTPVKQIWLSELVSLREKFLDYRKTRDLRSSETIQLVKKLNIKANRKKKNKFNQLNPGNSLYNGELI